MRWMLLFLLEKKKVCSPVHRTLEMKFPNISERHLVSWCSPSAIRIFMWVLSSAVTGKWQENPLWAVRWGWGPHPASPSSGAKVPGYVWAALYLPFCYNDLQCKMVLLCNKMRKKLKRKQNFIYIFVLEIVERDRLVPIYLDCCHWFNCFFYLVSFKLRCFVKA